MIQKYSANLGVHELTLKVSEKGCSNGRGKQGTVLVCESEKQA